MESHHDRQIQSRRRHQTVTNSVKKAPKESKAPRNTHARTTPFNMASTDVSFKREKTQPLTQQRLYPLSCTEPQPLLRNLLLCAEFRARIASALFKGFGSCLVLRICAQPGAYGQLPLLAIRGGAGAPWFHRNRSVCRQTKLDSCPCS